MQFAKLASNPPNLPADGSPVGGYLQSITGKITADKEINLLPAGISIYAAEQNDLHPYSMTIFTTGGGSREM
ncbi:hypothetical protein [Labrys sp. 22185]|uniref:hypothetical protein n=1 Tax=Labrys sp. 22185 TaxID=3453888 RepID=UPI003F83E35A